MSPHRSIKAGLLSLLALLTAGRMAVAAWDGWPPVSSAEKALKDCPGQPGAPAICLRREDVTDYETMAWRFFRRLKVLTPGGKTYADVEIPQVTGWRITELHARVVQPGGEIQDFHGQVFEKTALRAGRFKMTIKSFALPDVDVGSIIDYSYELEPDEKTSSARDVEDLLNSLQLRWGKPEEGGAVRGKGVLSWPVGSWEIRDTLFTVKARFIYIPFGKGQALVLGRPMRIGWVSHGLPWGPPEMKDNRVELIVEDVPAREDEEFMPPEDPGRMGVHFFFCDNQVLSAEDYWQREGENWQKGVEDFLGRPNEVAAEARTVVAGIADPVAQLRKLYERAQGIQNLSYDRSMTPQHRREMNLKVNRKAADVLKRNYGLRSDITRTFVALARAAGLSADVARVVSRDDKFFHENLISFYLQFDTEMAVVNAGGRVWLLDPATPFCPMGLARWCCSETTYIQTSSPPSAFRSSPATSPETAITRREMALRLDEQGDLTGTVGITFTGQEALVRRLDHLGDDDPEVRNALETEMSALLPAGAKASLRRLENMRSSENDVRADFEIAVPGIAVVAGGRMLLPSSPLQGDRRYLFRRPWRKTSVYIPYPRKESDDIVISLPPGMRIEGLPAARREQRPFAEFSSSCTTEDGPKLHIRRELVITKSAIALDEYPLLKSFFDDLRVADEEQVVLSAAKK